MLAKYIEILKRKLGINLKNPDTWKREHGSPHTKTDRDLAMDGMLKCGIGKRNSSLRLLRDSTRPFTRVVLRHPWYTLPFDIHTM